MKVVMSTTTHFGGEKLEKGKPVDVEPAIAERWKNAGIASAEDGEKPIEKMNTAELTAKAAELGVDISAATNNKQRAEAITAHIAAQ